MRTIQFNQANIAYEIQGMGTPLVFIHGFGEDSRMWNEFIPYFHDHMVIRIDLPGFGQSDVLDGIGIEDMAGVIKTVLDALNIKKCILIGHSMGGYVTLAFAKKYESRLFGYGLFHSHPYADTAEKKEGRNKGIEFISNYGSALFIKQMIPTLFASKYAKNNPHELDKMSFFGSQIPPQGLINALKAMRDRPDNSSVLEQSGVPVLFIIGKEDAAVPLDYSLDQTHLPKIADIHIFEKTGHMGMFEQKKATQQIIADFIEFCGKLDNYKKIIIG